MGMAKESCFSATAGFNVAELIRKAQTAAAAPEAKDYLSRLLTPIFTQMNCLYHKTVRMDDIEQACSAAIQRATAMQLALVAIHDEVSADHHDYPLQVAECVISMIREMRANLCSRPAEAVPVVCDHMVAPAVETTQSEADFVAAAIIRVYKDLGQSPKVRSVHTGSRIISVELTAGAGRVRDLDNAEEDMKHRLYAEHGLTASYVVRGGKREVMVARQVSETVKLDRLMDREVAWLSGKAGRFIVGECVDGTTLRADLSDSATCHLLVGGTTGSGKSVLLKSIVTSLARFQSPADIRFTLIDPKRVTFNQIRQQLGVYLASPVCYDIEAALPLLEGLVTEMERRFTVFERNNVCDLEEFNAAYPAYKLARQVIVIDEFSDLVTEKTYRERFETAIKRLGSKARAAGIHLILATQRPDAKTIPSIVKANLPGAIALRVPTEINSRIIIDEGGASELLGNGDLLARLGSDTVRAQGAIC